MIRFADENTTHHVRRMWKECFGDSERFLDIYFKYKYKPENTLLYYEGENIAASLQMLPYTINFYGQEIPFAYLAGLNTLPEYRKKGYMAQLIHEAHRIIAERNIALAILIPAEEWLYGFYEKYGYEQVFQSDDNSIPLKKIIDTYPDEKAAYREFDLLFRPLDFCIQKTEDDFKAIVEDFISEGCPKKTNLSGMARIIDPWTLLEYYAKENLKKEFNIKIVDKESDKSLVYYVDKGEVGLLLGPDATFDIEVDIRILCKLLFGYKIDELDEKFHPYFENHQPIMNLMLE